MFTLTQIQRFLSLARSYPAEGYFEAYKITGISFYCPLNEAEFTPSLELGASTEGNERHILFHLNASSPARISFSTLFLGTAEKLKEIQAEELMRQMELNKTKTLGSLARYT